MRNIFFEHKSARSEASKSRFFIVAGLVALMCAGTVAANVTFVLKWGSGGSGDGEFFAPAGLAVDTTGKIYLADAFNHRIQKFDANGTFVGKWGSFGSGDGEFYYPYGVAVDISGNVFVADANNHRIQKFDANENFVTKWGASGVGDGQFDFPVSVAVDAAGNVFVADPNNNRIQKFDSNGNFLAKWGSAGTGDGEFAYPLAVAVGPDGKVYVSDQFNQRIQKFDSNGVFITKWGGGGTGDGEFNNPDGVAVDSLGYVYVTDQYSHRIQKFDSSGNYVEKWGSLGSADGEFDGPYSVAVDDLFNVYVGELVNVRVQKFSQLVPNQGGEWVTGGGWINSPAGAYAPNPLLTGKATFGFVSKYENGANVPTGQTEFQLKMGSINFHSSSYDWMLVAGAKAYYKGSGRINGSGDYAFIISAIDGRINGGVGPDKIRIKIWNKGNGALVYDSQPGSGDQADPTTVLGGGSIVIHH
ncbi:MAG TPA: 6-bladed beta-propeller [Blastocatellia bacterium]|nr:6-bladed beta-propeller [Blastocatellia bacterium]